MKKKSMTLVLLFLISTFVFADGTKYYRTKEEYGGYVKMLYQCRDGERGFTIYSVNENLFNIAKICGYSPYYVHLSEAHWCLLEESFWGNGGKENAIYNISIKVDGEKCPVQATVVAYNGQFHSIAFAYYGPL